MFYRTVAHTYVEFRKNAQCFVNEYQFARIPFVGWFSHKTRCKSNVELRVFICTITHKKTSIGCQLAAEHGKN